jgi:hypothetical protein
MAHRDELGRALGGQNAGEARGLDHVPLGHGAGALERGGDPRPHAHDRHGPRHARRRGLAAHVDHPRPARARNVRKLRGRFSFWLCIHFDISAMNPTWNRLDK